MASYGFVGGPTCGDRPDKKSTPFILRMLSEDLSVSHTGTMVVEYQTWSALTSPCQCRGSLA